MADHLNKSNGVYTSSYADSDGKSLTDIKPKGSDSLSGKVLSVTNTGTKARLSDLPYREVTVIARKGNTGSIFVGGSDVSSSLFGVELKANESFTFAVRNANLIYIDASVSGEGVSYVAL